MRAVVQRVSGASVSVEEEVIARIGRGLLVLLAAGENDGPEEACYVAEKLAGLRIFEDAQGKMNLSALDVSGAVLLVSQFTLYGDCRKGRRPSFTRAARPEQAEELYELVASKLAERGLEIECGKFGAEMQVALVNDGPVTVLLDSERTF